MITEKLTLAPEPEDAIPGKAKDTEEAKRPASEWQVIKAVLGADEFALNGEGLYQVQITDQRIKPVMLISAPITIVADTRDAVGQNWGRILEFHDKDGKLQQYSMKMQDLRRDGDDVVDALLYRGLSIAPGKKARLRLIDYIQNSRPENDAKARSTEFTGWHGRRFVLPTEVIGAGEDRIIYYGRQPEPDAYGEKGTLEDWKEKIASKCVGNSRLVLAVSTCFAAALINEVGDESGGLHFIGNSSTGKSTALHVAASVMGKPKSYIQSWRATSNGLEGIARFHNDTCLMLDEMSQVQPREAGEIAYMLANGSGKLRATIKGDARQKSNWRLLFLSSGEVTLAEHMDEGGKKAKAGQEIRLVDIQADAGKGAGIFEELHGAGSGAAFSDLLKANAALYHGTAFKAFIRKIVEDTESLAKSIKTFRKDFAEVHVPGEASGQVERVASRFALIACAGELATKYGITGWDDGEASEAACICFKSWLNLRGGSGQQESKTLLDQVKRYFELYGDSHFVEIKLMPEEQLKVTDANQRVTSRSGFRTMNGDGETVFFVLPQAFREICKGHNFRNAVKTLLENKVINPANNGKSQWTVRLPGMGPKKVYFISGAIWKEPEHEEQC